jgi:hypothetical protein
MCRTRRVGLLKKVWTQRERENERERETPPAYQNKGSDDFQGK